ncbi:MAG: cupin domain-containing protein [Nitrososphaeraceae archaeon]
MISVEYWIKKLGLIKHPEGGYYKENFRSDIYFENSKKQKRSLATSIYYLLEGNDFSSFHKIKSDEIWHFYYGSNIIVHVIEKNSSLSSNIIGNNIKHGNEKMQMIIEKDLWFAAEVSEKSSYSLVGCTVIPGFEFDDFELSRKEELVKKYPMHENIIRRLSN